MSVTDWVEYEPPTAYKCPVCKKIAHMVTRKVEESSGSHKEYRVICERCGTKGPVHWSRALAEHSWKAMGATE